MKQQDLLENQKYIRFRYSYKGPKTYERQQEDIFTETLILVQRAESIPVPQKREEVFLNNFKSEYDNKEDPEQLIKYYVCDGEIQDQSADLDLKDIREGNYTVCYQNYLNENEVIFERSDKKVYYSFDFKKKSKKKDTKTYLYKYGIKLKNPLQNKNEILKLCKRYEKVDIFLGTEKL